MIVVVRRGVGLFVCSVGLQCFIVAAKGEGVSSCCY